MRRVADIPAPRIALSVHRRFGEDGAGFLAATITYHAFLSLFPLLLLALSVIGFTLAGDPGRQAEWTGRLARTVPGLGGLLGDNLRSVVANRAGIGIVGLAGLAWTGRGLVKAGEHAVGRVLRRTASMPFLVGELWALGATVFLGTIALASVVLAAAAAGALGRNGALGVAGAAVAYALDAILFASAYRVLGHRRGFRGLWPGAAVAALGWTALRLVGSWYAARTVAGAEAVYGSFAAVVGVLVLVHLGARLFLYGAELNAVLVERRRPAIAPREPTRLRARAG
jgi:YihY family inner membrane protein